MLNDKQIGYAFLTGIMILTVLVTSEDQFRIDGISTLMLILWMTLGWLGLKLLFGNVDGCDKCSMCYRKLGLRPIKH